ncbi:MAG: hypothetical protein DRO13_02985 [Thermoprotei archaeon]|nr:MAG: hypothetical protein DRO13_02985 [Thermoprotei archaeon]
MRIRVLAYAKPTEDPEKVREAVLNVFNGEVVVVEEGKGYYRVEGFSNSRSSLNKMYNLVRAGQIAPAVRSYLLKNKRGNAITILLHKQAAYMGKISLIDSDRESPLGAIRIEIEHDNPYEIINWLAPEHRQKRRGTRSRP